MAVCHHGRNMLLSCRIGKHIGFHRNLWITNQLRQPTINHVPQHMSRPGSRHLPFSIGNQRSLHEVNLNWSKQTRVTQQITRKVHSTTSCYSFDDKNDKSGAKGKTMKIEHTLEEVVIDAMNGKYRVSYVDEGDKSKPVILCLHGMPTSHKDFLPMTPKLLDGGARVILPNFPGVGLSWCLEGAAYDYTNRSKAKLIEALLAHLRISKVDMLVSHSSSGHSGMELCANTDLIENVTFICPVSHLPHGI